MAFLIDKQTLEDLNIFGKRGKNSLFSIFNTTQTRGGSRILEEMFRYPLSSAEKINERSSIIRFFLKHPMRYPFNSELFDIVESYLSNTDARTRLSEEDNTLQRKLKGMIGADTPYTTICKGVSASIELVQSIHKFVENISMHLQEHHPYQWEINEVKKWLSGPEITAMTSYDRNKSLSYTDISQLDEQIRFVISKQLTHLLTWAYRLDVYLAVAQITRERNFCIAQAKTQSGETLHIEAMYHPGIQNAIPNSLNVDSSNNVIFLTGANMAGKSTFMKTLGTVMFLAHMGFPVPAREMRFSVQEGMFTTINLPDNLNMGYSHFYAEVLRIKKVITQLENSQRLIVIFDELFRGTNVKDANEATVAITQSLARKTECLFVISTHITEAGEQLRNCCRNVNFVYFPTVMKGSTPQYTYQLTPGITSDRHGMVIIRNEKLLELLEKPFAPSRASSATTSSSFSTDEQTLKDLNLLGEFNPNSIFFLFNRTRTRGGKRKLDEMFRHPLNDATTINQRSQLITFFQHSEIELPFSEQQFTQIEQFFSLPALGEGLPSIYFRSGCKCFLSYIGADNKEYQQMLHGMRACLLFLQQMKTFVVLLKQAKELPEHYRPQAEQLFHILHHPLLDRIFRRQTTDGLNWHLWAQYNYILHVRMVKEMEFLMNSIYNLDALISVATVARIYNFHTATAIPFNTTNHHITIKDIYHPCLQNAITNDIMMDAHQNVLFLTGANMAGKSTLMKAFGIAVYLAHMGFPVACREMQFTVQDGLYVSINVTDNINMGYSHYYAEVLRVKQVAERAANGQNLVVLFDELFKGTNVKDAHEATVKVTRAFSAHHNCSFIISTHIIEAGNDLQQNDNFHFVYIPTIMKNGVPTYPRKLKEGITDDRHGMLILRNERIID